MAWIPIPTIPLVRITWLAMTRGNRLLLACLVLAALAGRGPSAMGQWEGWPEQVQPAFLPVWRGQGPEVGLPSVAAAGPDAATVPLPPEDGELAEGNLGYGDPGCGGPILGGHGGWPSPEGPLAGPTYRFYGRHGGLGEPLVTESWLYRPLSAGWSMGFVKGDLVTSDWQAGEQQGFFGAVRLGWDHDHHWGSEMRFAFDSMNAKSFQWDLDLLYYPWGDSRWRPYYMLGLGAAKLRFRRGFSPAYDGGLSAHYDETVFVLPLAVGMKYRCNDWMALRLEVADLIVFGEGSGLNTMVNLSITGGFEIRFGGRRTSYWPWDPGRHYW